jgi:hypothetical protein
MEGVSLGPAQLFPFTPALVPITVWSTPQQGLAWEKPWTVVTLARNGFFLGVAVAGSQGSAIAAAIRNCRAMATSSNDCGAQFTTIRAAWTVASPCGEHAIIATGDSLANAERAAVHREIELQFSYLLDCGLAGA